MWPSRGHYHLCSVGHHVVVAANSWRLWPVACRSCMCGVVDVNWHGVGVVWSGYGVFSPFKQLITLLYLTRGVEWLRRKFRLVFFQAVIGKQLVISVYSKCGPAATSGHSALRHTMQSDLCQGQTHWSGYGRRGSGAGR